MSSLSGSFIARARTDSANRLIEAQEPLASLQQHCGGEIPGVIAIPELRELVQKVADSGLRLARTVHAHTGDEIVSAWVEATPTGREEGGCFIGVASWQTSPLPDESEAAEVARKRDIDQSISELTARLDAKQGVLTVESEARDLADLTARMRQSRGHPWTEFVTFPGNSHQQPLHWRLLDGAECRIEGSDRVWTASLIPLGQPEPGSSGFDLYLVPNRPLIDRRKPQPATKPETMHSIGRDLSPVLRQPIARIIANAETIRSKMAGPLAEEYSNYASDIASAGQHLMALIEDLSDLEVVESESFTTAPDQIDAADVARRAVGILNVRAMENKIKLVAPASDVTCPATAEFRRVLQILLNLVTNAIRYSPEGSTVEIGVAQTGSGARVTVSDQGSGLTDDQQAVVFEKFERLGRTGDGGSGLGLYISRRIARAMGGDLKVKSAPGEGARFILDLPAAEAGK
ncbi:sensor histidine kinase [Pontixanthobacter aquaemixtae]|uniref:histidine kinase n=1 Tax=Pontixanthobacter aquaemixtae TaxID=1958940 RepID=A0A844ZXW4_9SPHN|nr:HAMP domain-containing sensor histidine kinase [Pontixanthobacter aquaemixtae]MXO90329.1 sensor histidine kinase [Pontixanthobacter aquaemixtae]